MNKTKKRKIVIFTLLSIVIVGLLSGYIIDKCNTKKVKYNEFIEMVEDKQVSSANLDLESDKFTFKDNDGNKYSTNNPKYEDFKKFLLENNIEVAELSIFNMLTLTLSSLTSVFMLFFLYTTVSQFSNVDIKTSNENVSLSDVIGVDEIKEEINTMIDIIKNHSKYKKMGIRTPRGFLLTGSAGVGKTMLAKAIANECGLDFIGVNGSDFIELYVGAGARKVRKLFKIANKKSPCIVFIDEIDAIGGKRDSGGSNSEEIRTLNALLCELDGFEKRKNVFVIASTNMVDLLDKALIRAGRFDKIIEVPSPNKIGREELFSFYLKDKKVNYVDTKEMALLTQGMTGADIEGICNEALIMATKNNDKCITQQDLIDSYIKIITKGYKKKSEDDDNREIKAYHESGHAVCSKLLTNNSIPMVSIYPTTSNIGGFNIMVKTDEKLLTKTDIVNNIKVLYAGRVAEEIMTGNCTIGASNDIEEASKLIKLYISNFGQGNELINYDLFDEKGYLDIAKQISEGIYKETYGLLLENKDKIILMSNVLMQKLMITENEIDDIMKPSSL